MKHLNSQCTQVKHFNSHFNSQCTQMKRCISHSNSQGAHSQYTQMKHITKNFYHLSTTVCKIIFLFSEFGQTGLLEWFMSLINQLKFKKSKFIQNLR